MTHTWKSRICVELGDYSVSPNIPGIFYPEHHNLRRFLTQWATVKSEADSQHRIIRNEWRELEVCSRDKGFGVLSLVCSIWRKEWPQKLVGTKPPGGQHWPWTSPEREGFGFWKVSWLVPWQNCHVGSYISDKRLDKKMCKALSNIELTLRYFSDIVCKFVCSVSLAITDSRSTFAGFACPFGNVPGLGDSRKRYDYRFKAF